VVDDSLWSVAKILVEVVFSLFLVYAIGAVGLMILKVIVNFIAMVIRVILQSTWGKCAALALVFWLVVTILRKG
jgi:hypothetical protein